MLLKLEKHIITDVFEFIIHFELEAEFKKHYGVDISDWEFTMSDEEVIDYFLDEMGGYYLKTFTDIGDGYFTIFKL